MTTTATVLSWVRETLRDPKEGAHLILSMMPARPVIWQLFAVTMILSILLLHGTELLLPPAGEPGMTQIFGWSPFNSLFVQIGVLLIVILASYWGGRLFGGRAAFDEIVLLVTWVQFILLLLQAVQFLVLLVSPGIAGLIGIVGLGLFFWMLCNFLAVAHGFSSAINVFFGVIGATFVLAFVLSFVFVLLGVSPIGIENV